MCLHKLELFVDTQADSSQNHPMVSRDKVARSLDGDASTQGRTMSAWNEVVSLQNKGVPAENEAMSTQNEVASVEN